MAYAYLTPYRRGDLSGRGRGGGGFGGSGVGGGSIFDLHRQMNRMFDDLLTGSEGGDQAGSSGITGWPSLDIRQSDKEIEICAELAGVNRDDISIELDDGMLIISGEKKSSREDGNGYSERSYGRFERRISVPAHVEEDAIQADLQDGLLTITLPLSEEKSRGRKIQLGSGTAKDRNDNEGQLIEGKSEGSGKKSDGGQSQDRQSQDRQSKDQQSKNRQSEQA